MGGEWGKGCLFFFPQGALEIYLLHTVCLNQLQIKSYFSSSNLPFYSNELFHYVEITCTDTLTD